MTSTLLIGDSDRYILLHLEEMVPGDLPAGGDAAFSIEMRADGFSGHDTTVWFGRQELDRFAADLAQLEKTLQGSAMLKDLSYGFGHDGFCLEFCNLDKLGHLAVRADLQKPVPLGTRRQLNTLRAAVCFEIELSQLIEFLRAWRELFTAQEQI